MGSGKLKKFNRSAANYYNGKKYDKVYKKMADKNREMYCAKCKTNVRADMVTGEVIYPEREDLKMKKFWQCPTCKNYCGYCATTMSIPTPELRRARRKIHEVIDPLWKSGMVSRGWVYKNMSEFAGYAFHNGNLTDPNEADKMYRAALKVRNLALIEYETKRRRR